MLVFVQETLRTINLHPPHAVQSGQVIANGRLPIRIETCCLICIHLYNAFLLPDGDIVEIPLHECRTCLFEIDI